MSSFVREAEGAGLPITYGPSSSGIFTVSVPAPDPETGIQRVNFPGLFETAAADDTTAP